MMTSRVALFWILGLGLPRFEALPLTAVVVTTSEARAIVIDTVAAPKATDEVMPDYQTLARSARVEGEVAIDLTIARDGTVRAIKDAKAFTSKAILSDLTIAALRQWRFEPAQFNSAPVEVTFRKTVTYSHERATPTIEDSPARISIDAGNIAPKLVTRIEPVTPKDITISASGERLILEVVLDDAGKVQQVNTLKRGTPALEQAAADALRQWVFEPATVNHKSVGVAFTAIVTFTP